VSGGIDEKKPTLRGKGIDDLQTNSRKRQSSEVIIPKEEEVEDVEIISSSANAGGDGQGDS